MRASLSSAIPSPKANGFSGAPLRAAHSNNARDSSFAQLDGDDAPQTTAQLLPRPTPNRCAFVRIGGRATRSRSAGPCRSFRPRGVDDAPSVMALTLTD
jgi:hypothetical protein